VSIVYAQEQSLPVADYVTVLGETTMREKRPLKNAARIGEMIAGANFIVTAREDGVILGLARCITDHAWVAYCAELAVRESAQGRGVGRGILEFCMRTLGPGIGLGLFSEPNALAFYEHLGLMRLDNGFFSNRIDRD
jgi:GNAT superfamily N-acetyltransferase